MINIDISKVDAKTETRMFLWASKYLDIKYWNIITNGNRILNIVFEVEEDAIVFKLKFGLN